MIYVTSDTHFNHKNIIKHCNRPFSDVDEMNEHLIKCWNYKVKPDDEVYHLGDVFYGSNKGAREILDRLNGRIYLIVGNHEETAMSDECFDRFEWVRYYHELHYNRIKIVMFHYPIARWRNCHHGSIHIYGHEHGKYVNGGKSFDVGVDTNYFYPYSINEVFAVVENSPVTPHHDD